MKLMWLYGFDSYFVQLKMAY